MRKFWIRYEKVELGEQTYGVTLGCGVTAESYEEALRIVNHVVFKDRPSLRIISLIEDVELSALDQKHVIPNIGYPEKKGVWYPAYNALPPKDAPC